MRRLLNWFGIVLLLTICLRANCQVQNDLDSVEFWNIKLGGKTLGEIQSTFGDSTKVARLFGEPVKYKYDNRFIEDALFTYEDIYIAFSDASSNNIEIVRIDILSSDIEIEIGDIIFHLGDNMSVLGDVAINHQRNGGKSILFARPYYDEIFSINFDEKTGTITKIYYFVIP